MYEARCFLQPLFGDGGGVEGEGRELHTQGWFSACQSWRTACAAYNSSWEGRAGLFHRHSAPTHETDCDRSILHVVGIPSETSLQSWEYVDATAFPVRGVNYLKDKVKVPSQPCAFDLVEISGFSTEGKVCQVLHPQPMCPLLPPTARHLPLRPPQGRHGTMLRSQSPFGAPSECLARQSATKTTQQLNRIPCDVALLAIFVAICRHAQTAIPEGNQQQVLSPGAPVSAAKATAAKWHRLCCPLAGSQPHHSPDALPRSSSACFHRKETTVSTPGRGRRGGKTTFLSCTLTSTLCTLSWCLS